MEKVLIWDCEIVRAIPERDGSRPLKSEGIEYCAGWDDFDHLGISTVGVWDCVSDMPLVFCADNIYKFADMANAYDRIVGFNSVRFDTELIKATGQDAFHFAPKAQYDILRELWIHDGLDPDDFDPKTHVGYSLQACAKANFGIGKSGDGASASIDWQRGQVGRVITYCLRDVMLTHRLFERIMRQEGIVHPKTGKIVHLSICSRGEAQ
jgi:hypothetical protein